ncbi:MinD/ParA family protein [Sinomonas sp. P10A9]|uniref:MinD/ParA family protein n=1 Tax=Sinomonas puerhi TaxID=3238584 RepID=A0AB39L176_9MICC
MEMSAGEQTPPPVPMTRREARRLREAEEAERQTSRGQSGGGQAEPTVDPVADGAPGETPPDEAPATGGRTVEPQTEAAHDDRSPERAGSAPETPSPEMPSDDRDRTGAVGREQQREAAGGGEPAGEGQAAPSAVPLGAGGVPPRPQAPPIQQAAKPPERPTAAPQTRAAPEARPLAPRVAPAVGSGPSPTAPAPVIQTPEPSVAAPVVPAAPTPERPAPVPPTSRHAERPAEPTVATVRERSVAPTQEPVEAPAGFIRSVPVPPPGGLRGFLYRVTGGALNLGQSERARQDELVQKQISRRLEGNWNTAFLSLKGGIGKTSTTVGVGLTLAELRPEPPCAIDANPDAGDLVERALGEGSYESERRHSITSLLRDFDTVNSRADLVKYLHHAGSLHLLAGEQDPELSDSLTPEDYRRVHALVKRHFTVTLTDCGTGVSRPAMRGILEDADNIVVVAGYAVSGAKRARDTLRWLSAHGYDRLAQSAIVVVTDKDDVSARVDKSAIEATLSGMCRALVTVPHDRSMADGDLVDLDRLRPATREAYREIAAAIVSGYQRQGPQA